MANVGPSGARQQLRNTIIVVYSLVVIATDLPALAGILPNAIVIPYFVIIPGYCVASLVTPTTSIIEKTFYTLAWSLAVVSSFTSISSLRTGLPLLPIVVVVPVLTLAILAFNYSHGR